MNSESIVHAVTCGIAGLLVLMTAGCGQPSPAWQTGAGVPMSPPESAGVPEAIKAVEATVPPKPMRGSGLAGAMGGVNMKALQDGTYDVRLPLPQLVDGQAPVYYRLDANPSSALAACRLQKRKDGNVFVNVALKVKKGDQVAIDWSSVILIAAKPIVKNRTSPEAYRAATGCAQADDPQIKKLAGELCSKEGKARDHAGSIQDFIGRMQPQKRPMSLDALGILTSGHNTICTANANLACAVMRANGVACRSIATVPTLSRRFEMHRVVEYSDDGTWVPFDPSRVYADIPLKPWQNIIMIKTSIADEQASMKPRLGAMRGCPFGQEAEFARPGLNLFGQAFFWTIAVPLAEFEVSDEAATLTARYWKQFLKTGALNAAQVKAASTRDLDGYLKAMKAE